MSPSFPSRRRTLNDRHRARHNNTTHPAASSSFTRRHSLFVVRTHILLSSIPSQSSVSLPPSLPRPNPCHTTPPLARTAPRVSSAPARKKRSRRTDAACAEKDQADRQTLFFFGSGASVQSSVRSCPVGSGPFSAVAFPRLPCSVRKSRPTQNTKSISVPPPSSKSKPTRPFPPCETQPNDFFSSDHHRPPTTKTPHLPGDRPIRDEFSATSDRTLTRGTASHNHSRSLFS